MSNFTDFIGGGGDSVEALFDLLNTAGVTGSQIDTFSNTVQGQAAWVQVGFLPNSVVDNATLMTVIAASSVVMNSIVASTGMMGSVADSSVAMTAVAANSVAMNLVAGSSVALPVVAASSAAMAVLYSAATKYTKANAFYLTAATISSSKGLLVQAQIGNPAYTSNPGGSQHISLDGVETRFEAGSGYPLAPDQILTEPGLTLFNTSLVLNCYTSVELAYISL